MQANFADQVKRHQGPYKRDFQRVATSFRTLGQAMEQDGLRESGPLTNALRHTGDTYDKIAQICELQPSLDWEPMGDVLHDYRGLLASYPDIITVHKVWTWIKIEHWSRRYSIAVV
jgi:sorting nexin-9/18/33